MKYYIPHEGKLYEFDTERSELLLIDWDSRFYLTPSGRIVEAMVKTDEETGEPLSIQFAQFVDADRLLKTIQNPLFGGVVTEHGAQWLASNGMVELERV